VSVIVGRVGVIVREVPAPHVIDEAVLVVVEVVVRDLPRVDPDVCGNVRVMANSWPQDPDVLRKGSFGSSVALTT
jgi:hypothetical protein